MTGDGRLLEFLVGKVGCTYKPWESSRLFVEGVCVTANVRGPVNFGIYRWVLAFAVVDQSQVRNILENVFSDILCNCNCFLFFFAYFLSWYHFFRLFCSVLCFCFYVLVLVWFSLFSVYQKVFP